MDSAESAFTQEAIADTLVEFLTQSEGLSHLAQTDLETIEAETLRSVDEITRRTLSKLLQRQAGDADSPEQCPRCGGGLGERPPQGRSLQSTRGTVHFKTDVFHCEACRLDFFPSVQDARL